MLGRDRSSSISLLQLHFSKASSNPQSSALPFTKSLRHLRIFDISCIYPFHWHLSTGKCRLQDCLKSFFKKEKLTDNIRSYRSHYNKQQDSLKRAEVWKQTPVLLLYLKHFFYDMQMQKLQTQLTSPQKTFDLLHYFMESKKNSEEYNLFSVSNHYSEQSKVNA